MKNKENIVAESADQSFESMSRLLIIQKENPIHIRMNMGIKYFK